MVIAILLAFSLPGDCKPIRQTGQVDNHEPAQRAGDGLWIGGIAFAPSDIGSAEAITDQVTGQWVLELRFTPSGNARFVEAQRCGVGYPIEISMDRKVLSRPILNERILGGQAQVSGGWDDRTEVDAVARRITGS